MAISERPLSQNAVEVLSGLTAGFMTTVVSHPLDFVKLRMQLDENSASQWQALLKIRRDLAKEAGKSSKRLVQSIYRGVGPNLIGSTTAWALYFAFYRQYKNSLLDYTQREHRDSNLNTAQYLGCAFCAGWSTSLLTNPIWVIKTRMISTSRDTPGAYQSFLDGVRQIYHREGLRGYFKGLSPALLNVSQGALQFSLYDTFKNHVLLRSSDRDLTTWEYIYASAISKMTATITLYPLQVVRSRLQAKVGENTETARALVRRVFREEGLRGFYKGIVANLVRVVPATCITFTVYEKMRVVLR